MEQQKISELVSGAHIRSFFLVDSATAKSRKSGDPYLFFTFKDKSGKISGNYWNPGRSDFDAFGTGDIVFVEAVVETYNEKLMLNIGKVRPAQPSDGVSVRDLVKSSPKEGSAMYSEIIGYINKYVTNEDMKILTVSVYEAYKNELIVYPAAISFHHAEIGGLLHHTIGVIRGAFFISQAYPFLNRDLLLCGAALHDIGKIHEYSLNDTGLIKEVTVDGNLVTHIIRGAMIVEEFGKRLGTDPEIIRLLSHMILSHHGVPEFGSSVVPKFPEAFILHEMDDIDAKLFEMEEALSNTAVGEMSERQRAFDDARLYRSPIFKINEEMI
ncbi:MAG: HD domain-containing protein [Clostridia bacterium]|nr:HD domain-containing protein [Clostridia bacterium]